MRRRRVTVLAVLVAAATAGVATAATGPAPVAATDAPGDVASPLDLTRVAIARSTNGRLRASVTLAAAWDGRQLLAASGPPGSVCVKLWTVSRPPDTPPDYLVCTTAAKDGALRGSVLRERANKLPERVAGAEVSRPSPRTVTLRFPQSAIGNPATLDAAAEASQSGCARVGCIDLAPDAPKTLTLKLRAATP
jgi:hypothetical protein